MNKKTVTISLIILVLLTVMGGAYYLLSSKNTISNKGYKYSASFPGATKEVRNGIEGLELRDNNSIVVLTINPISGKKAEECDKSTAKFVSKVTIEGNEHSLCKFHTTGPPLYIAFFNKDEMWHHAVMLTASGNSLAESQVIKVFESIKVH